MFTDPIKDDVTAEEAQVEECNMVAAESESNCQVNGDISEKHKEASDNAAAAKAETTPAPVEEKSAKETKKEGKKAKKGKFKCARRWGELGCSKIIKIFEVSNFPSMYRTVSSHYMLERSVHEWMYMYGA